ncbi:MAG TPA: hypothetical protein DC006_00305, partial [Prevotellaceae bacterium]|nr:hypothetical protein [Prevotellaceae bacterium]
MRLRFPGGGGLRTNGDEKRAGSRDSLPLGLSCLVRVRERPRKSFRPSGAFRLLDQHLLAVQDIDALPHLFHALA